MSNFLDGCLALGRKFGEGEGGPMFWEERYTSAIRRQKKMMLKDLIMERRVTNVYGGSYGGNINYI